VVVEGVGGGLQLREVLLDAQGAGAVLGDDLGAQARGTASFRLKAE
jgi:hypothetical protein